MIKREHKIKGVGWARGLLVGDFGGISGYLEISGTGGPLGAALLDTP